MVFKHGDGGLWCARQAGLVKAGGQRVLAFTELWNYTGNFCFLKTGPPPEINDYGLFQVRNNRTDIWCTHATRD